MTSRNKSSDRRTVMTNESKTPETTPATLATEPKSYLMWIGKEHYPTIESYVDEAIAQGVSKRVSRPDLAAKLATPGTMVYLAHDEGARCECPDCQTVIENPERRKAEQAFQAAETELENRKRDYKAAKEAARKAETEEDKTATAAVKARAHRLLENAEAKALKLAAARDDHPAEIKAGSGGHVILKDGSRWDYRRYMYWRNQPKKWDYKAQVAELHMCEHCGGFGQLPVGKVFGVFMPDAAEYILKPEDNDKVSAEMKDKGLETVTAGMVCTEVKRGCGKRVAGGTYLVTKTNHATPEQLVATIKELVEKGVIKPDETKVNGSFAEFIAPVDIAGEKRFRGVKEWAPTPEAADEGEMIAEAMS
jgi:hypothetical protein